MSKDKNNVVPDALSRAALDTVDETAVIDFEVQPDDLWYTELKKKLYDSPNRYNKYKIVENKILINTANDGNEEDWKIVVPPSARQAVLTENHDDPLAAHLGIFKTVKRIQQKYFWPGLPLDVKNYVKNCTICKTCKSHKKPYGLMGNYKECHRPFQLISLDLMGPFPRSSPNGNCYLLVVVDFFTKFPSIFPIRQATSKKVCQIMENSIFLQYGVPEIVIADNGKQFQSTEYAN